MVILFLVFISQHAIAAILLCYFYNSWLLKVCFPFFVLFLRVLASVFQSYCGGYFPFSLRSSFHFGMNSSSLFTLYSILWAFFPFLTLTKGESSLLNTSVLFWVTLQKIFLSCYRRPHIHSSRQESCLQHSHWSFWKHGSCIDFPWFWPVSVKIVLNSPLSRT